MRLLVLASLLGLLSFDATAQSVITVAPGAGSPATVAPGAKLAVPIVVDMSAAMGANLAGFATGVTWNAERLTLDSVQAAFPALTADLTNRANGRASLSFTNAGGNSQTLATLHFTASATTGGASVQLQPTVATNENGASLLPMVRPRLQDVCVAPSGKWGDVNGDSLVTPAGDGNVNIIDAQQIARFSVSLAVSNRPGLVAQGDVTGDGTVNIIDAQQIARFSVGLTAAARTSTLVATPVSVASTLVSPATTTLAVGQTLLLVATPTDAANASLAGCVGVTWASLNPAVATVDTTGLVTAVSAGAASFTVTSGGQSASAAITVAVVHVASVGLAPATGSIYAGGTLQLTATPKDSIGGALSGRPVTWTSSDTTVAIVSAAGLVIAKAPGTVTVTATSEGVSSTAAALTIALVPVASIVLQSDTGVLFIGRTRQLTATLKDSADNVLTGRTITWAGSDTALATVSATGLVTAVTSGTATITATSGTVSTPVTVRAAVRTAASVTVTPKTPTLLEGDSLQMIAVAADVYGEAMSALTVVWVSSAPTIAMIAGSGLVRGIAAGTARIIASVGTRSDTAEVVVQVASSATATVAGTDSTHVAVASGSSVTVQAGVLVAGSSITVADASSTGADGSAALGGALTVTIAPPAGAASATLVSGASRIAVGNLSSLSAGSVIVELKQAVGANYQLAGKKILVGVTYAADRAKQVVLEATDAVVSIGVAGAQLVTTKFEVPAAIGNWTIQYLMKDTECGLTTWDLSNFTKSGSRTSDPTRIPVILVHGIQLEKLTCDAYAAYHPESEVWDSMVGALNNDPHYEVWVYRYPTMLRIEQNAEELRDWIDSKIGPRPVILVAHSMGGLVSARYMQQNPYAPVKQLIALSSPFKGSPLVDLSDGLNEIFTNQVGSCLSAQGDQWVLQLIADAGGVSVLTWLLGRIPGAEDLKPSKRDRPSPIVDGFRDNPDFAKRLTSYASWFNWAMPSNEPLWFYRVGGCILQNNLFVDNDGMVPVFSTQFPGAKEIGTTLGYTHNQFPLNAVTLVKDRLLDFTNVASIELTPNPVNIGIGQKAHLAAKLLDIERFALPSQAVTWSWQPSGIVSVAVDGTVTGLATGDATVTATTESGSPAVPGTTTIHVRAGASTLPAPTLIAPAISATGVSTTPTLQWSPVTGANRYWLTVATSASALPTDPSSTNCPATSCLISGFTNATSHTLPNAFESGRTGTLAAGSVYYWKVQGYNNAQVPAELGLFSASGSFTTAGVNVAPVASVVVTPTAQTVTVGQAQLLTATLRDAQGSVLSGRAVVWSSSNTLVATVSSGGIVTALTAGSTTITASVEGKSANATLTVTANALGVGFGLDQFSLIPVGTFQMGASPNGYPDELPVHAVTISHAFFMQKTEITQGQWRVVMGSNPSVFSSCGDTCPVENVSWNDIQTFLQRLNASLPGVTYRLPTEAEWEYAARAGTTGDAFGAADAVSWNSLNSGGHPHSVVGKQVNAWGLYDVLGNVWEWVSDWYGTYSSSPGTDPSGPATGTTRVLRGGAWNGNDLFARSAVRNNRNPSTGINSDGGFRLARAVTPADLAPVASVVVTPAAPTLAVGQTQQLTATLRDAQQNVLSGRTVVWSTSNASVATVNSSTGLATAIANGSATITAISEGKTGTAAVTVNAPATGFAALTAGGDHTCGLTSTGAAYCWGANWAGQLGDGTTTDQFTPVAVQGGLLFVTLTAGTNHTCGLTSTGAAYCWGFNGLDFYRWGTTGGGQLGDGTDVSSRPLPVAVQGGLVFTGLTAGPYSTCGLTGAGAAYCWGANYTFQLGDGTKTRRLTPVAVSGGLLFKGIAVSQEHTCAWTSAGVVYCWGDNFYGQGGTGGSIKNLPVPVYQNQSELIFSLLTVGYHHTCGLTSADVAYCWGYNGSGVLGGPSPAFTGQKVAVQGGLAFATLATGEFHNCGRTSAGLTYCWGNNGYGQLGDGTAYSDPNPVSVLPTVVQGGVVFAALTAGADHTCGLTSTGAAYCWGYNGSGQLGDGTSITRLTPVEVIRP